MGNTGEIQRWQVWPRRKSSIASHWMRSAGRFSVPRGPQKPRRDCLRGPGPSCFHSCRVELVLQSDLDIASDVDARAVGNQTNGFAASG